MASSSGDGLALPVCANACASPRPPPQPPLDINDNSTWSK